MSHHETISAQRLKGRHYVTRAANIHIYTQEDQPTLTLGGERGRHVTLVDNTTGHEVTMDDNMLDFILTTLSGPGL